MEKVTLAETVVIKDEGSDERTLTVTVILESDTVTLTQLENRAYSLFDRMLLDARRVEVEEEQTSRPQPEQEKKVPLSTDTLDSWLLAVIKEVTGDPVAGAPLEHRLPITVDQLTEKLERMASRQRIMERLPSLHRLGYISAGAVPGTYFFASELGFSDEERPW